MPYSNSSTAHQAASLLVHRRRYGIRAERLPESCRPLDIEAALAIQAAVTEQWCELLDDSIGAWKCGVPIAGKVIVAPIYTRTIDTIPPVALWPTGDKARIEPELAFFFGRDLPPREEPYTPAEVDAAIIRTHLALELVDSRYSDASTCGFAELLADGLVNQGLFIGPEANAGSLYNLSEFTLSITHGTRLHTTQQASHPNGNPRLPLYWLAEFLRSRGQGIVAGQAVITGSFAGVLEVPLDTDIVLGYQGLGDIAVRFTARPRG